MANVICVKCNKKMVFEEAGVLVLETKKDGTPYKVWSADLFRCFDCEREVITHFAFSPLAQSFDGERFQELAKKTIARFV